MTKLLQNKVAESKIALPVTALYATIVWLLGGLVMQQWWLQFGCFALSAYLMAELNNVNALIRVYSRMVSCTFLVLSCCVCFLFPSFRGFLFQLCFIGSLFILFYGYQDKEGMGITYYAFFVMGLASMAFVQVVYLLPLLWILMLTHLQMLSWRTFFASLFGLLTPYWIGACWLVYMEDFAPLINHLMELTAFQFPFDYSTLTMSQVVSYAFLTVLAMTGIVHYIRSHQGDKIRIRMLYGLFSWIDIAVLALVALQPQHYDMLIRISIVCTAPLLGHFITLTSTRITNVAFIVMLCAAVLLTGFNLWTASSLF